MDEIHEVELRTNCIIPIQFFLNKIVSEHSNSIFQPKSPASMDLELRTLSDMHPQKSLMNLDKIEYDPDPCCGRCCGSEEEVKDRRLKIFYKKIPRRYKAENIVRTQLYSVITFLPLVLINQFKFFFNFFFLAIALTQFYPPLKVGFMITYIGPLAFVLIVTMAKEFYDDFKRNRRDTEANSKKYKVFDKNWKHKLKKSQNLKVGDVIEINAEDRIPADVLLLYTSEPRGTVFLRTDQLDGETDWKLRRAVRYTQDYFKDHKSFIGINTQVTYQPPKQDIYEFLGVFQSNYGQEPLSLEHTFWASTSVASGTSICLILYTGKDTRVAKNSHLPRCKFGIFDLEVNFMSKLLFAMMVLISAVLIFLKGFTGPWYMIFFRYLLLLSSIIPISMRINLDFGKAWFSILISTDKQIEGCTARNTSIPEELGRVDYLLSDKTGTLTKNEMILRKITMIREQYNAENFNDLIKRLKKHCEKNKGPMSDYEKLLVTQQSRKFMKREHDFILRDIMTAMVLCHNVTPSYTEDAIAYQASSPDEISFVKFCESVNLKLLTRDQNSIQIQLPSKDIENYKILAIFPFKSSTKRMGILLRHVETNRVVFYLKGADSIMEQKVKRVYSGQVQDESENLAREGFRTLVFAQSYITEEQYQTWKRKHDKAKIQMQNRDQAIQNAANLLEVEMDFLGVTGVEDKLQDDVAITIESMTNAGIKVWMLTGDKVETAKCIAVMAGIKTSTSDFFEIKERDALAIKKRLIDFSHNNRHKILLIDGTALAIILNEDPKTFIESSMNSQGLICARCHPKQKAKVAKQLQIYSGKRVACIGDGGNDVAMIQVAHLGLGIMGKEGNQAALSSDFSISEFKHLQILLLWHGRLSYKRSAKLSQFVIHRGLIISFIQALFTVTFYYVAIPIYNGMLIIGYATVYTSLPVFSLILDEDIDQKHVLKYPLLYKTLQKGRQLNVKTFLLWTWKSLYQASVIFLVTLYMFQDSFLYIVTITFSALIIIEMLNVYSEVKKVHPIMIAVTILSLITYFITAIFLKEYIMVSRMTFQFLVKVLIIAAISWLPIHLAKKGQHIFDPSESDKLQKIQN